MYVSASQIPSGSVLKGFDICIAGAGAAGIAMAHRLIGSSKRVLVLANGSPTDAGQPNPTLEEIYGGTLGAFTKKTYSAIANTDGSTHSPKSCPMCACGCARLGAAGSG